MSNGSTESAPLTTNKMASAITADSDALKQATAMVGNTGRYARLVAGVGFVFVPLFLFFGGSTVAQPLLNEMAVAEAKLLYVNGGIQFVGALISLFSAIQLNRFAVTAQELRTTSTAEGLMKALRQLRVFFGAAGILATVSLILYIAGRIALMVSTAAPPPPI